MTRFYAGCWVLVALIAAVAIVTISVRTMNSTDERYNQCIESGGTWHGSDCLRLEQP